MTENQKQSKTIIEVDIGRQMLFLRADEEVIKTYYVSTASNGPGEEQDSECTPRGLHVIAEKIGAGCLPNTVFVGRQPTGELFIPELRQRFPDRDWIITRILWLRGCEPGVNQGGNVDTYQRCVYIHGAPDDVPMGKPGSRGCIRMHNSDVVELFDMVEVGTKISVTE